MLAKVEKCIPNSRRLHNCRKDAYSGKPVCVKCGAHEPDHTEDTYLNCNESHRTDSKLCKIWEKERDLKNQSPKILASQKQDM